MSFSTTRKRHRVYLRLNLGSSDTSLFGDGLSRLGHRSAHLPLDATALVASLWTCLRGLLSQYRRPGLTHRASPRSPAGLPGVCTAGSCGASLLGLLLAVLSVPSHVFLLCTSTSSFPRLRRTPVVLDLHPQHAHFTGPLLRDPVFKQSPLRCWG